MTHRELQHPHSTAFPRATSVFTDGSALFFGQREFSPDKNMDYWQLWALLQRLGNFEKASPALFFTASDPANDKQVKFHGVIEKIGWNIIEAMPSDAVVNNPTLAGDVHGRWVRFDAGIAYSLGRVGNRKDTSHAIVISDSFALSMPVCDFIARGGAVTVAFFGTYIDPRWHRLFGTVKNLRFVDLAEHSDVLFSKPKSIIKGGHVVIPGL